MSDDLERRLREWADSGIYELLDREVMLLREAADALASQRQRIAELEGALAPFAKFACSPRGECECHNCVARDFLGARK